MTKRILFFGIFVALVSCKPVANTSVVKELPELEKKSNADFTIAFGSCNKTNVKNLLWDDISNVGVTNGLALDFIGLKPEQRKEFYVELPITIEATGTYHDFGAFVSGVSSLPRIVTLHDFTVVREKSRGNKAGELKMEVLAKTYRYKDD